MRISAHLRFADVFRFNVQFAASRHDLTSHAIELLVFFLASVVWLYLSRTPTTQPQWVSVFASALTFAIACKLMWFATVPVMAAIAASNDKALGEHEFEIGETAFTERNNTGERVTLWKSVRAVDVLQDFVAVKIGQFTYHIIPASAFGSREDFEKFCNELGIRKTGA